MAAYTVGWCAWCLHQPEMVLQRPARVLRCQLEHLYLLLRDVCECSGDETSNVQLTGAGTFSLLHLAFVMYPWAFSSIILFNGVELLSRFMSDGGWVEISTINPSTLGVFGSSSEPWSVRRGLKMFLPLQLRCRGVRKRQQHCLEQQQQGGS